MARITSADIQAHQREYEIPGQKIAQESYDYIMKTPGLRDVVIYTIVNRRYRHRIEKQQTSASHSDGLMRIMIENYQKDDSVPYTALSSHPPYMVSVFKKKLSELLSENILSVEKLEFEHEQFYDGEECNVYRLEIVFDTSELLKTS